MRNGGTFRAPTCASGQYAKIDRMTHHGIRLRIGTPDGPILDADSDALYLSAMYGGNDHPLITGGAKIHEILRTTEGLVITAEPVELPDDYPDDEDLDDETNPHPDSRPLGGGNDPMITVESNQHPDCLTLRFDQQDRGEDDLVHLCDWPAAKAAIDAYQRERGGKV